MQCAAIKQAAVKLLPPAAKLVKRIARGRSEGGPAVLRDWIGTWTQAMVPHQTATWTAATIAPLDCGPKKPEPGQHLPQPCPRKLRSISLAGVLMKLTESCASEQHIDKLLKSVEPTYLGLGTPDAAALIVRIVSAGLGERHGSGTQGKAGRCRHPANRSGEPL